MFDCSTLLKWALFTDALITQPSAVKLQFWPGHLGEMLRIFAENCTRVFTSATKGIRCELLHLGFLLCISSLIAFIFCALCSPESGSIVLSHHEKVLA